MGEVYEGRHLVLKKRVAIKCLASRDVESADLRRRFMAEGEKASLVRHENVVDVTDLGVDGDTPYMVMEYLRGRDLAQKLVAGGPVSPAEMLEILLPVCSAVAAAHDVGVIHRDLKPANIFLSVNNGVTVVPKILDFGIAKITKDHQEATGHSVVMGTPGYVSPEQLLGQKVTAQVDQYALGVMMYQVLSGMLPYEASSPYLMHRAVAEGKALPLRSRMPDVDPRLEEVVMRAMAWQPASRYPSVRDLCAALLPFAGASARRRFGDVFESKTLTDLIVVAPPVASQRTMVVGMTDAGQLGAQTIAVGRPWRRLMVIASAAVALGALVSMLSSARGTARSGGASAPKPSAPPAEVMPPAPGLSVAVSPQPSPDAGKVVEPAQVVAPSTPAAGASRVVLAPRRDCRRPRCASRLRGHSNSRWRIRCRKTG
jgi:serine/threonine-protein kinase